MSDLYDFLAPAPARGQAPSVEERTTAEVEGAAFAQYREAVEAQLARLQGQSNLAKRRATILALAEEAVRPDVSRRDVFARPGVVSQAVFYNTAKDWGSGSSPAARLFQEVLEEVIGLTQAFYSGRDLRRMEARRTAWQERVLALTGKGMGKLEMMLEFPLSTVKRPEDAVVEEDEDGRPVRVERNTIVLPAGWSMGTVATLLREFDRAARLAMDMDTEREQVTVVGMTVDEWRKRAEERRLEAAETLALFEDPAGASTPSTGSGQAGSTSTGSTSTGSVTASGADAAGEDDADE